MVGEERVKWASATNPDSNKDGGLTGTGTTNGTSLTRREKCVTKCESPRKSNKGRVSVKK